MTCSNYDPVGVHNDNCRNCFEPITAHAGVVLTAANQRQVGGNHYKETEGRSGQQHWDMVDDFALDYFQGQITKYLFRWRRKNGIQDLNKAKHYLEKYIELAEQEDKRTQEISDYRTPGAAVGAPTAGYVDQEGAGVSAGKGVDPRSSR